jgi:photosystem II stability/assembly factor-like uncharacterized protein
VGNGAVLHTVDAGQTWQARTSIDARFGTPYSVAYPHPDIAFVGALAGRGHVLRSSDGGLSWDSVHTGHGGIPYLFFVNSQTGWATAADSIYKTIDGGASWTAVEIPARTAFRSIFFTSDQIGFAVGFGGSPQRSILLTTIDGGDSWAETSFASADALQDVWFADAQHGAVVGRDAATGGTVLLTTANGGGNWTEVTHDLPSNFKSWAVSFADLSIGTIVGSGTEHGAFRTEDGGSTWVLEDAPGLNAALLDLVMLDAQHGIAVGQNGEMYRRQ